MMRKIKFVALLLSIFALGFSCSEDNSADPYVLFSASEYNVVYNIDSTYIRVQSSDASWSVTQDSDSKSWATLEGTTASNESKDILVRLVKNEGFSSRTATFVVSYTIDGEEYTASADLIQAPQDRYINPNPDTIFVSVDGGVVSSTITANVDWEVTNLSSFSWLSNDEQTLISEGTDSIKISTLELTVGQNSEKAFRIAPVELYMLNRTDITNTLYIYQLGTGTVESDSLALVECYNSLGGASWINSWDLSQSVDSWYGVTVDEGTYGGVRVVSLDLSNNNLVGTLPTEEIGSLSYLYQLSLYGNSISGEFNSDLCKFHDMRFFYLNDNHLTGTLPDSLLVMEKMMRFRVESNSLSGTIPEFGTLPELTLLSLAANNLTGKLPELLGSSEVLEQINVSGNRLSGEIPSTYTKNLNWYSWGPDSNIYPQQDGYVLTIVEN